MITDATTSTYTPTRDAASITPRAEIRGADAAVEGGDTSFSLIGDGELSFWDFLDVINPLQHIPLLNSAYRELTGDTIKPIMKLAGGALFGGPLGLGLAAVDVGLEGTTGKDTGQHVAALFKGEDDPRGTAYRLYNEAVANEDGWRDNSEALAKAEQMLAALDRADATVQTAAIAPTLTVVPAAAASTTPDADTETLPPWDASAATPATRPAEGKAFPMPDRRRAQDPRPVTEARAHRTGAATPPTSLDQVPPGLSAQAMEAAGLTPDAVQQVLKQHAQAKAEDTALAASAPAKPSAQAAAQTASLPVDQSEPLWFFDRMNAALDKYRAAQDLAPAMAAP